MSVLPEISSGTTAFVETRIGERMHTLARSSKPQAHVKLRLMLYHFDGFRPSLVMPVTHATAHQYLLTRTIGTAGERSWAVLSVDSELDGHYVDLDELVSMADFYPDGTFAVHRTGLIAYYRGETAKEQLALVAHAGRK